MEANFIGDLMNLRCRKGEEGKRRQNVACLEKESLSPGDPGPCIQIPALLLMNCVTLSKLPHRSVLNFLIRNIGVDDTVAPLTPGYNEG